MPIRTYDQREIRTGRARLEKPLLLAVLLAQVMFCYADANWLLLAASAAAMGGSWLAAHWHREIYVRRSVLNIGVVLVGVALALSRAARLVFSEGSVLTLYSSRRPSTRNSISFQSPSRIALAGSPPWFE